MPKVPQPSEPQGDLMYEYAVESQWAGWWGGYGSEHLLVRRLNEYADRGWHLIAVERIRAFWWWMIPRPKLLYVFERGQWENDDEDGDDEDGGGDQ